jgi:1-deoxy-D-xylulose-5-phosphate synthase
MILERINRPGDIKKIRPEEYEQLASEIREFLIESTSKTGGHLASNLGVVELTMALHIAFAPPRDKIIWDVGHQAYTHKLLTGRRQNFDTLRTYGGMSGFPKRKESDCDCFDTGHSSTSISAGLGIAKARDLSGKHFSVVSVIGDGSLTGGMAYEALNNASSLHTNFIIVLNDNTMSISPNVGGISSFLAKLRTSTHYKELKDNVTNSITNIPKVGQNLYSHISNTKKSIKQAFVKGGMLFEDMDITYLGPFDGHDVQQLVEVFRQAKKVQGPVVVHVLTHKGRGYTPAEENPSNFHGVAPFDVHTGHVSQTASEPSYTDVFGETIRNLGMKYKNILAITAAMMEGTGLSSFAQAFPERFFDVGIAEQHAVTYAAGLASQGYHPVVAVYSSFLQRAYDQILHDVCLQDLPVIFGIDRAGLVGCDGETHQGIFDYSYLLSIPGMTVLAPKNAWELEADMEFAAGFSHPIAIRYPRGSAWTGLEGYEMPIEYGKAEWILRESELCILAIGSMVRTAMEVHDQLHAVARACSVVNLRFAAPIDYETVEKAAQTHRLLVVMEENVASGGVGEHIAAWMKEQNIDTRLIQIALPNAYIEHGSVDCLKKMIGIDSQSVFETIYTALNTEEAHETAD